MDQERRVWDETQLRKYDISLKSVPKYKVSDPKVEELIAARVSGIFYLFSILILFLFYFGINYNKFLSISSHFQNINLLCDMITHISFY